MHTAVSYSRLGEFYRPAGNSVFCSLPSGNDHYTSTFTVDFFLGQAEGSENEQNGGRGGREGEEKRFFLCLQQHRIIHIFQLEHTVGEGKPVLYVVPYPESQTAFKTSKYPLFFLPVNTPKRNFPRHRSVSTIAIQVRSLCGSSFRLHCANVPASQNRKHAHAQERRVQQLGAVPEP